MNKLVFVGGHHTTALAVIDALPKKAYQIYWLGHRHSIVGDTKDSAEYKEVAGRGLPFYDLLAGKFYKTYNPLKLLRIPFGFVQAIYYLLKIRPDLVISFGGYLSVPVGIMAWLLGVPVLIHEQTVVAGFANRLISHFAKKVLLTWPQSLSKFPKERSKVVGLPLRPELLEFCAKNVALAAPPLIYITGGKQGSHILNEAVYKALPGLLTKYQVIHQCGDNSIFNDYERFLNLKKTLPKELAERYIVNDFFDAAALGKILAESSLVVGRSGANTVYELLAFGKPCLLIPLPWVSHNEQFLNAKVLVDASLGKILTESELTGQTLQFMVSSMLEELNTYQSNAVAAKNMIVYDASNQIAAEIKNILATR